MHKKYLRILLFVIFATAAQLNWSLAMNEDHELSDLIAKRKQNIESREELMERNCEIEEGCGALITKGSPVYASAGLGHQGAILSNWKPPVTGYVPDLRCGERAEGARKVSRCQNCSQALTISDQNLDALRQRRLELDRQIEDRTQKLRGEQREKKEREETEASLRRQLLEAQVALAKMQCEKEGIYQKKQQQDSAAAKSSSSTLDDLLNQMQMSASSHSQQPKTDDVPKQTANATSTSATSQSSVSNTYFVPQSKQRPGDWRKVPMSRH